MIRIATHPLYFYTIFIGLIVNYDYNNDDKDDKDDKDDNDNSNGYVWSRVCCFCSKTTAIVECLSPFIRNFAVDHK